MNKKALKFELGMKFDAKFILEHKSDILSVTLTGLFRAIVPGKEITEKIAQISHTNQVFSSRSICFSKDGKAKIKSVYTDIGQEIISVFDSDCAGIVEKTLSYRTEKTNSNGQFICKIILFNENGLDYGVYYCDNALTTMKTSDTFNEETYLAGETDSEINGFVVPTAVDMKKVGCWFQWIDNIYPAKWDDSCGTAYPNIRYGEKERNLLDLYEPKIFDTKKENGILIHIHGGGWLGGDKFGDGGMAAYYTKRGYFVATMNYSFISLEKGHSMFTILDEMLLALAKIKSMSDENGWNITKAAMKGESAGGHLSMLHAYSQNAKGAIPVLFVAEQVGPIDMRAKAWENLPSSPDDQYVVFAADGSGQNINIDQVKSGEFDELLLKVSPITYLDSAVPTIMSHGIWDTFVNPFNGRILDSELTKHRIRHDYVESPNSGHAVVLDRKLLKRYFGLIDQYLKDYFGY